MKQFHEIVSGGLNWSPQIPANQVDSEEIIVGVADLVSALM